MKKSSKRFVLSDQTKNLFGFITITAGIDLSAFSINPVMLYNHEYDKLIGQWTDWKINGTQLTAIPEFDDSDAYAMQQYSKVEAGILKGASVGLSPVKFNDSKTELSNSILLEASLTPVPNNRNALAIYNEKGHQLSAKDAGMYLLSLQPCSANDGKGYDYYALNTPGELAFMQRNDPSKFDKLVADKIASVRLGGNVGALELNAITPTPVLDFNSYKLTTYDDYALNAPGELALMQRNDPGKFDKLVSDKVATVRLMASGLIAV